MAEEYLKSQRLFIERVYESVTRAMPSIETFENPLDWHTHVQMRAAQQIASGFLNVHNENGRLLSIDEIANGYKQLRSGSAKDKKVIADLNDELDRLRDRFTHGGPGRGNH